MQAADSFRMLEKYRLVNPHSALSKKEDIFKTYPKSYVVDLGTEAVRHLTNVRPYSEPHPNSDLFDKPPPQPLFPEPATDRASIVDFASPLSLLPLAQEPFTTSGPRSDGKNSCYLDSAWWICQNLKLGHLHVDQMTARNRDALSPVCEFFAQLCFHKDLYTDSVDTAHVTLNSTRNKFREFLELQSGPKNGDMSSVITVLELCIRGVPQATWSNGQAELCGDMVVKSTRNISAWQCSFVMGADELTTLKKNGLPAAVKQLVESHFLKSRSPKPCTCDAKGDAAPNHMIRNVVWDRMPPTLLVGPPTPLQLGKGQPGAFEGIDIKSRSASEFSETITIEYDVVRDGKVKKSKAVYQLVGISRFAQYHYSTLWKGREGVYFWDDQAADPPRPAKDWHSAEDVARKIHPGAGQIGALIYRQSYMTQ